MAGAGDRDQWLELETELPSRPEKNRTFPHKYPRNSPGGDRYLDDWPAAGILDNLEISSRLIAMTT